ncbi:MAG: hypothetical protein P8Q28_05825 [Luminiphilus sp.]|nr:hypothetical protein [Luminiphilus sp.]
MIDRNSVIIGEVKNKKFIEVQRAATKGYADCFQRGIKIPARKLLDIKNPFSNARNTLPVKGSSQGYVTTAVVSILAILSLFATRNMIVATVDNFRSAGYSQALTTSLYAAEVALQATITEMETRSGLATASNCFEVTLSNVEIDTNLEATASYRAEPLGATTVGSETRYLYRVYATAVYRVGSATVSQIVSVDVNSPNTVYLLPATWTDRLAPCALP